MKKRVGLREWGVGGYREVWEDLGASLLRPCSAGWLRAAHTGWHSLGAPGWLPLEV